MFLRIGSVPQAKPATVLLSSLVAVLLGMFATLGWAVQKRSPSPTHGPVPELFLTGVLNARLSRAEKNPFAIARLLAA
jgi:hypothetical protein